MSKKIAVMADVARETGLSMATVSKVLNKDRHGTIDISMPTQELVIAASHRIGYRRNALTNWLTKKQTNVVGGILTNMGETSITQLIRHLESELEEKSLSLHLTSADKNRHEGDLVDGFIERIRHFREHRVDGLAIFVGTWHPESLQKVIDETIGVPTVLYGCDFSLRVSYVDIARREGVRDAVEHLYRRGYRPLVFIGGNVLGSASAKVAGFKDGVDKLGISENSQIFLVESWDIERQIYDIDKIVGTLKPGVGVIVDTDIRGALFAEACVRHKFKVGDDIGVLFIANDHFFMEHGVCPMSCMSIQFSEVAKGIANILTEQIAGRLKSPVEKIIKMELRPRRSTSGPLCFK